MPGEFGRRAGRRYSRAARPQPDQEPSIITRRTAALFVVVLAVAAATVLPGVAADRFDDGPGGLGASPAKPHQGWKFLYHVVKESRSAELGTRGAAFEAAEIAWAGPPARAESVELVHQGGPFDAPVPPSGTRPSEDKRVVEPTSSLAWVVWGRVRGGPRQMIGQLDYRSGLAVWDIRPLEPAA